MAFLKSSQITGLSARDVDVRGFTQSNSINLGDRAYTEHEVLLADAYNIKGDVTVSDNLILSKLSDDGDDITITGDTTTRTISGSGSIEGATLAQTPNASLTGMTGAISSAVTGTLGTGITFPAGSVIQVVSFLTNGRGSTSTNANQSDTDLNPSIEKTIIPKGTGSSFLIKIRWMGEAQDFHGVHANIHRDGARINATNPTTTPDFDFHLANMVQAYHGSDYDSTNEYLNFETFDKTGSATGESITFKLVMSSGSNKTVWTNRCAGNVAYAGGTSEIIIMEIAG